MQGEFGRIALQLSKIEIMIKICNPLFNFIIHLLTDNLFVPYRLHDFWYEVQKKAKKICERNRASRLEGGGDLEGFQTFIHLRGSVGGIYSACDV